MPRLLLMRHAKAERGPPGGQDFDRALSERGWRDARAMGKKIAADAEGYGLVLCSSSVRTRQTWDAVREASPGAPEPVFLRALYDGSESYRDIVRRAGKAARSVLLIGHNPLVHAAAVQLAADLSSQDGAALKEKFPTAAVAVLDFDVAWAEIAPGTARLSAFLQPPGKATP